MFDTAFLMASPPGATTAGDWMSVDVTDGTTTVNVLFADGTSSFPRTSVTYGLAMTAIETQRVDLAELFPGSDESTPFTMQVRVSTTGSGASAARGYLDHLRFASVAAKVVLYGCQNPTDSLVHQSGIPALGKIVWLGVDNPLGTQAPGSATMLILSLAPAPGYPCGTSWPSGGMIGGGAPGEVLVDLGPPVLKGFFGAPWTGPGAPAPYPILIPRLPVLIGRSIYAQGVVLDATPGAEIPTGWTRAAELRVGP